MSGFVFPEIRGLVPRGVTYVMRVYDPNHNHGLASLSDTLTKQTPARAHLRLQLHRLCSGVALALLALLIFAFSCSPSTYGVLQAARVGADLV
jgi:hypothetical protein